MIDIQKVVDTLMCDIERILFKNFSINVAEDITEQLRPLLNCYTRGVVATVKKEKENG